MGKCVYLSLLLLFVSACATHPNSENIPKFSYLDSLQTAKTINCSSRKALDCMACALQGEAANQPSKGIYAVGVTIMTRAKGNINRICRVTKARRQFEGMKRYGKRRVSKKILGVSQHILKSKEVGWTHFWAPRTQTKLKRKKPYWAHSYDRRKCLKKKIGDHIFYNINKCQYNRRMRINAQNN